MDVVAIGVGVVMVVVLAVTLRRLGSLEQNMAAGVDRLRGDIAALRASQEHARDDHERQLSDVEQASAAASNEVRMAAGQLQALGDALSERMDGAPCVLR